MEQIIRIQRYKNSGENNQNRKHKKDAHMSISKPLLFGSLFGLLIPVVGLFVGLQVSVALGNIMTLPFVILSQIMDVPFGDMSAGTRLLGWLLSAILWAGIFYAVAEIIQRVNKSINSG